MALRIDGAATDGNGLIKLQVHEDGSISAPVSSDPRTVASGSVGGGGGGGETTGPISEFATSGGPLDPSIQLSVLTNAQAFTLGPGTANGQNKYLRNGAPSHSTVSPLGCGMRLGIGSGTVTELSFTAEGDFCHLKWDDSNSVWILITASWVAIGGGFSIIGTS